MDTLNSQNAFADMSRDEDELASALLAGSQPASEVEDKPSEDEQKEAFLKLAHAM